MISIKSTNYRAPGGLGELELDEIDAANSFLMLPMARNGLKWPVVSPFVPQFSHNFLMISKDFHMISVVVIVMVRICSAHPDSQES